MRKKKIISPQPTENLYQILEKAKGYHELAVSLAETYQDGAILMLARSLGLLYQILTALKNSSPGNPSFFSSSEVHLMEDLAMLNEIDVREESVCSKVAPAQAAYIISRVNGYIELIERELTISHPKENPAKLVLAHLKRGMLALLPYWWVFAGVFIVFAAVRSVLKVRENRLLKGHGLVGEYFATANFTDLVQKRLDYQIDFNWKTGGPTSEMSRNRDYFSVMWTGYMNLPKSGNWEFSAKMDDMVKFWVDDRLILNEFNWMVAPSTTTYLAEGLHAVKIQYAEVTGLANIHLYSRHEDDFERRIIPALYFYQKKPEGLPSSPELLKMEGK